MQSQDKIANPEEIIYKLKVIIEILREKKNGNELTNPLNH